jgi:hypothetical protein
MSAFTQTVSLTLGSSIGKKFLVALTGAVLVVFVLGHLIGNLLIFAGPDAIDYSATLEDPQTFSRPWTMRFRLVRNPNPQQQLMEFKCVPFTEQLLYGEFYKQPRE